jgi:hypothetical protein
MTILEVQPLVLKDVELLIGTGTPDDFRKHVSGVTYTPSSSTTTWTGLGKNTHTDAATPTWVVQLDYVQDWTSTTGSLSQYLFEHEGETLECTFTPTSGVGPSFTSNVTIVPGAIGGQVNAFATTTVSLGSDKPVLVPALPLADDVDATTPGVRQAQDDAA